MCLFHMHTNMFYGTLFLLGIENDILYVTIFYLFVSNINTHFDKAKKEDEMPFKRAHNEI